MSPTTSAPVPGNLSSASNSGGGGGSITETLSDSATEPGANVTGTLTSTTPGVTILDGSATGVWFIKLSTTAYSTVATFQWGLGGDVTGDQLVERHVPPVALLGREHDGVFPFVHAGNWRKKSRTAVITRSTSASVSP